MLYRNTIKLVIKMSSPKPLEILIQKRDKNYYHARIKDTKYSCDDVDIYTTLGRLVFENQEIFNVKITVEHKESVKKTIGGKLFNTNPGSSLP